MHNSLFKQENNSFLTQILMGHEKRILKLHGALEIIRRMQNGPLQTILKVGFSSKDGDAVFLVEL